MNMIYSKTKTITIDFEVTSIEKYRRTNIFDKISYLVRVNIVNKVNGKYESSSNYYGIVENLYSLKHHELDGWLYNSNSDKHLSILSPEEIFEITCKLVEDYGKKNLLLPSLPSLDEDYYYNGMPVEELIEDVINIPYFDIEYRIENDKLFITVDKLNKVYNINMGLINIASYIIQDVTEYLDNLSDDEKRHIINVTLFENKLENNRNDNLIEF